jgi:hypothetical protein
MGMPLLMMLCGQIGVPNHVTDEKDEQGRYP